MPHFFLHFLAEPGLCLEQLTREVLVELILELRLDFFDLKQLLLDEALHLLVQFRVLNPERIGFTFDLLVLVLHLQQLLLELHGLRNDVVFVHFDLIEGLPGYFLKALAILELGLEVRDHAFEALAVVLSFGQVELKRAPLRKELLHGFTVNS